MSRPRIQSTRFARCALLLIPLIAALVTPTAHDSASFVDVLHAAGVDDPPPGHWVPQGPAPAINGQVENLQNPAGEFNNEVTGAVHTVITHPRDSNVMYIGTVNGGVWKTTNADRSPVVWTLLTDGLPSQSIGALDADPSDPSFKTIVAGTGRFSSFSRTLGGSLIGLLRTTDGGATWQVLDGGGTLIDKNVSGVAARRSIIVVSSNTATPNDNLNRGVYRSTDGGATFERISRDDLAHGLPGGVAFDLVGDSAQQKRLYVPITSATGGPNGIYRSDDTGATWTKISDAAMDAQLAPGTTNVELAVGKHNNVFVAIARSGRLSSVFRSRDGGSTWTAMSIPITPATVPQGIHPGGQASIHMAIAADPSNPNIVYISGDRQPDAREEGGTTVQFPNALGARNYAGRLFRGDASQPPDKQWSHLTNLPTSFMPNGGTLSDSSPHADSREMAFDADGRLVETDDGGVFRRTRPQSNRGDWMSLNGNLQVAEQHSLSYDSLSKVSIVGTQDIGTPFQIEPDDPTWNSLHTGDGGDVAVDDFSTPGLSIRYSSFQNFSGARRTVWNSDNVRLSTTGLALNPLGGAPRPTGQFYTPIAVNRAQGERLLIAGSNGLYESFDRGANVARIDTQTAVAGGLDSLAYGAANNPDAIYMARADVVKVRLAPPPAPLVASPSFGASVVGVVMQPDDANFALAVTTTGVFWTTNGGGTWTNTTGNLQSLNPLTLRTVEFVSSPAGNAVVVGSLNGVYYATQASGFAVWQRLGTGLPVVPVYELTYSRTDDVLVAGTLGRGAFKLTSASSVLAGGL